MRILGEKSLKNRLTFDIYIYTARVFIFYPQYYGAKREQNYSTSLSK